MSIARKLSKILQEAHGQSFNEDVVSKSIFISKKRSNQINLEYRSEDGQPPPTNILGHWKLSVEKSDVVAVKESTDAKGLVFEVDTNLFITKVLHSITKSPKNFWKYSNMFVDQKKERVVLEFSSINIAKPFHMGHLRSTILGNCIGNLHRALDHQVVTLNYLGDWGTQFGLLLAGFEKFGDNEQLKTNPVQHLYDVYVKSNSLVAEGKENMENLAREQFMKLEQGDKHLRDLWSIFRTLSITALGKTYQRLGVRFDDYHGESMYGRSSLKLLDQLVQTKVAQRTEEGTVSVPISNTTQNVIVGKSDGTSLYITRELAAAIDRMDRYKFDKMLYVVENGQTSHFQNLFHVLQLMGHDWYKKLQHVKFGRVHGMSTRRGQVVFLEDVLDEAKARVLESMRASPNTRWQDNSDTIADRLGVAAVIVNDLKVRKGSDYTFNWERALHTQGDSGIAIQYTHARLCSLEKKCEVKLDLECDTSPLVEPAAIQLVMHLARFDEVLHQSFETLEPYIIVRYILIHCHRTSQALKVLKVKGEAEPVAKARLLMFHAARHVLASSIRLLGIEPVQAM